jgi:DNA-binding MarR family transcriptional regulator
MNSYPNQYTITINKDVVKQQKGRNRVYLIIYRNNLTTAMKQLSGTAFKVYIYLASNQDGFTLGYSPQDISNETGISKDSARKALKEFEEKGFLFADKSHTKNLNFYEKMR